MIIIPEDALRIAEALSAPIDELGLSVRRLPMFTGHMKTSNCPE